MKRNIEKKQTALAFLVIVICLAAVRKAIKSISKDIRSIALYDEFEEGYLNPDDNTRYKISPEDTATIINHIRHYDAELNDTNTSEICSRINTVYNCMGSQKIRNLYDINDEQWSSIKEAIEDFAASIGLNADYEAGNGIIFSERSGKHQFTIMSLEKKR